MRHIALFALALTAAGCGTVIHGGSQRLPVSSNPPGATVRASCTDGTSAQASTPGALVLPRNAEGCTVTVEKSGYRTETVALRRGKSAAMVGNIGASVVGATVGVITGVLGCAVVGGKGSTLDTCAAGGGLIGLLFPGWLDARTGAMYTQHPDRIDVVLQPESKP